MSVPKYLLTALAVAGVVNAQCSATTTIQNSGDASAVASCRTFTGDIVIATGTTDNIALDGIREIDGSLRASNVSKMTEISSSSLEFITESLELIELQTLTSLNMPRLTSVKTIKLEALANLQQFTFTSGVQVASTVDIQNTELYSLDGVNLRVVDRFIIANNPFLKKISLQLGNITEALLIESNANELAVDFPNLEWAYNMTLRKCASINVPSLDSLNGSLGIYSGSFESFSAPKLTSVGQSLSFVGNEKVTNISLPLLRSITGGFQIANNSALEEIDSFPVLRTVGGALDFDGPLKSVQLPALENVRGAFRLQSSEDISNDCNRFKGIAGSNKVIKGKFTCEGGRSTDGSDPTRTSTGSSPGRTGAAGRVQVSSALLLGISAIIGATYTLL